MNLLISILFFSLSLKTLYISNSQQCSEIVNCRPPYICGSQKRSFLTLDNLISGQKGQKKMHTTIDPVPILSYVLFSWLYVENHSTRYDAYYNHFLMLNVVILCLDHSAIFTHILDSNSFYRK